MHLSCVKFLILSYKIWKAVSWERFANGLVDDGWIIDNSLLMLIYVNFLFIWKKLMWPISLCALENILESEIMLRPIMICFYYTCCVMRTLLCTLNSSACTLLHWIWVHQHIFFSVRIGVLVPFFGFYFLFCPTQLSSSLGHVSVQSNSTLEACF